MRKEQVVLILTAGVLGWLAWSTSKSTPRTPPARAGAAPTLERPAVPDGKLVATERRELDPASTRELFAPPSDTRPLPPGPRHAGGSPAGAEVIRLLTPACSAVR